MLPREYRLPVRQPAPPLFRLTSSSFSVKVFRDSGSVPRFGFVVSKKVSTKAVTRNEVKRLLRSIIEEMLPQIPPGYGILFIVQKEALGRNRSQLQEELRHFLSEKNLLA